LSHPLPKIRLVSHPQFLVLDFFFPFLKVISLLFLTFDVA
jgi:hypothetical protein